MDINYLYDIASKEKIDVFDYKLLNINGVYIEELKTIGLDKSLNDTERKCVLAEELGHYYCNATYPISCTDKTLVDKAEYRAKKWATKALVSPNDIERIKSLGLQCKWEIAEELGVTEPIAENVFDYLNICCLL